jgi:hypothetical protein
MLKKTRTMMFLICIVVALAFGGPALAASTEDQAQTNSESGVGLDAQYPAAQVFTAGRSGDLDKVSLNVALAISRNVGDLRLAVQSLDSAGRPSGTTLGSASLPSDGFTVGAQPAWRDLTFAQPVPVAQGTSYALVVSGQNSPRDGSFYNWRAALTNPYAGGDAMWINPSTGLWEVRHDNGVPMDFAFKTFVTDSDSPTVTSTAPRAGEKGVSRGDSITARFSEPMDRSTLTTQTVSLRSLATGRRVPATVSCEGGASDPCVEVTLNPFGESTNQLKKGTKYRVSISSVVEDASDNRLDTNPDRAGYQGKTWTFTTGRR